MVIFVIVEFKKLHDDTSCLGYVQLRKPKESSPFFFFSNFCQETLLTAAHSPAPTLIQPVGSTWRCQLRGKDG